MSSDAFRRLAIGNPIFKKARLTDVIICAETNNFAILTRGATVTTMLEYYKSVHINGYCTTEHTVTQPQPFGEGLGQRVT